MSDLQTICPAATLVSPPRHGPSVVCGALEITNADAAIDGFRARGQVDALISGRHDRATVREFCCGTGVPDCGKSPLGDVGARASYTACELWRALREGEWADRRGQHVMDSPGSRRRRDVSTPIDEYIKSSMEA